MNVADTREEATRAVKDAAKNIERQVRASSEHAYESVKTEAERVATERRDGVASYAHDVADALHGASDLLEERGRRAAARLARRAAEEIGGVGQRVEGQDVNGILHNVEDFARQRPGLFLGGAFLLSFALVRYFSRASGGPVTESLDDASAADPAI
ncbi:MAG: hypothetical protein U1E66_04810 [Rhodospirillales bacterium]